MNCASGILSNTGTIYTHTFGGLALIRISALRTAFWHDWYVNVSGGCAPSGWSAGPNLPTVLVRAVGVWFPADGNFYSMGGRTADTVGSDFQHVLRYTPSSKQLDPDGGDTAR